LKCPDAQSWREELQKSERPQNSEELTVRKTLSKMPLSREAWAPSHTILDANGKTGLRKQNLVGGESKNEIVCRIEKQLTTRIRQEISKS
jgi:hypothetical protein